MRDIKVRRLASFDSLRRISVNEAKKRQCFLMTFEREVPRLPDSSPGKRGYRTNEIGPDPNVGLRDYAGVDR
jgi:hypothetical protein